MDEFEYFVSLNDGIHLCDQAAKVQYEEYGKLMKVGILLLGVLMILSGAFLVERKFFRLMLIVLGIWALISYNYPFVIMSERRARATEYQFYKMEYRFMAESVTINQSERDFVLEVPYKEIIRLIEDDYCFYFFLSNKTCYLFQKESFDDPEDYRSFCAFITEKTGLEIRQRKNSGLRKLAERVRDGFEKFLYVFPFMRKTVDGWQDNRVAAALAYEEQQKKQAEEAEAAKIRMEENMVIEQKLHDELLNDPEKMEEFKKSVMR